MRQLLLLPCILFLLLTQAQPPKVLPGVFIYDIASPDYFKVSNTGNSVAMKRGSYQFVFFDIQKGIISQADRNLSNLSSDHRYLFRSDSYPTGGTVNNQPRYAWEIKTAGISSDTALRRIVTDHYALDMDAKGNIIASQIWYDSANRHVSGMKGVYKLDRQTGKILQSLRADTLFTCTERNGCWFQGFYLQKNYLAFAPKTYFEPINIYPFDGSGKIIIPAHNYHTVYADSLVLFTVGDSTLDYRRITAFDVHTGRQLGQQRIQRSSYYGQQFSVWKNKMYIMQTAWNKIEEWTANGEGLVMTRTWDFSSTMDLSKDQNWNFSVVKGPSFFVAPSSMQKGEAGGVTANTAHFFNGATSKINLQVYPFYNRTADDVAAFNKAKKESDAWLAKINAEKDSIAHPERYCHYFWNTGNYRKGITIFWGAAYHIMADYDCVKDKYKIWRPAQLYNGNGHYMQAQFVMVSGREFRDGGGYYSRKQYVTCEECDGDGTYDVTTYTTKTKDLPWGYFSGIETKRTSTTKTVTTRVCSKCMGNGIYLK